VSTFIDVEIPFLRRSTTKSTLVSTQTGDKNAGVNTSLRAKCREKRAHLKKHLGSAEAGIKMMRLCSLLSVKPCWASGQAKLLNAGFASRSS
jgi:hypothetical protein